MSILADLSSRIAPPDPRIAAAAQRLLDDKTKPRRSLGRLEDLACQIAAIRGTTAPAPPVKAIVVMGADHGVVAEGVSAYPSEVTGQMLRNFARGGAAINVLARQAGARVVVVDMGVKEPLPPSVTQGSLHGAPDSFVAGPAPASLQIRAHRIGAGTANLAVGPAMSRDDAITAIGVGVGIATELAGDGVTLLGIGEMGIGNTTASSALTALFTGAPPEEVTGRGTGIDDDALRRKIAAIRRGLAINAPDPGDPVGALAKVGGFELAGLCGVVLGAAAARIPVVMDGFIASTAALCAVRLVPATAGYLIASHRSVETGHRLVLAAIGARPLLDLDLRLGEGTGAALAMGLIDAALRILEEMATFGAAGVADSGA